MYCREDSKEAVRMRHMLDFAAVELTIGYHSRPFNPLQATPEEGTNHKKERGDQQNALNFLRPLNR